MTRRRTSRAALIVIGVGVIIPLGLALALVIDHAVPDEAPTPADAPSATLTPSASVEATPDPENLTSPDRLEVPIPEVTLPGFVPPPEGQGLDRYLNQPLTWEDCALDGADGQCATASVPLDYDTPDGQAITLALFKKPATATPRLGTLFVNPGGPGEPGRALAARKTWTGLEGYDVVGWDPRGTGASTPISCGDPAETDQILSLDASPDSEEETRALFDGWKEFGLECLANSGALLSHVSTQETVYDLDILRHLVGDDTLTYLGYSYGTFIGALYAQTYPDTVGRMALDSPVNITDDTSISQQVGFDEALTSYATWCAESGCSLGATSQEIISVICAFLDSLDAAPLAVGDRALTQTLAAYGIALYLYFDQTSWESLTNAIEWARTGQGAYLLNAADFLWGRDDQGSYGSTFSAFRAINCLDSGDSGIAGALDEWEADKQRAPIFGTYFGIGAYCAQWPATPWDLPLPLTDVSAPILVVGATGDSATPYQYAQWMAQRLPAGILLTYDGPGHATFLSGRSQCVDREVVRYFSGEDLPLAGVSC